MPSTSMEMICSAGMSLNHFLNEVLDGDNEWQTMEAVGEPNVAPPPVSGWKQVDHSFVITVDRNRLVLWNQGKKEIELIR